MTVRIRAFMLTILFLVSTHIHALSLGRINDSSIAAHKKQIAQVIKYKLWVDRFFAYGGFALVSACLWAKYKNQEKEDEKLRKLAMDYQGDLRLLEMIAKNTDQLNPFTSYGRAKMWIFSENDVRDMVRVAWLATAYKVVSPFIGRFIPFGSKANLLTDTPFSSIYAFADKEVDLLRELSTMRFALQKVVDGQALIQRQKNYYTALLFNTEAQFTRDAEYLLGYMAYRIDQQKEGGAAEKRVIFDHLRGEIDRFLLHIENIASGRGDNTDSVIVSIFSGFESLLRVDIDAFGALENS
jgi:hypothetical protein